MSKKKRGRQRPKQPKKPKLLRRLPESSKKRWISTNETRPLDPEISVIAELIVPPPGMEEKSMRGISELSHRLSPILSGSTACKKE